MYLDFIFVTFVRFLDPIHYDLENDIRLPLFIQVTQPHRIEMQRIVLV